MADDDTNTIQTADEYGQKLLKACDDVLDFYCGKGKTDHPAAHKVRAQRKSLSDGMKRTASADQASR